MIDRRALLRAGGLISGSALVAPRFAFAAPSIEAKFPAVTRMIASYVGTAQAPGRLPGMMAAIGWGGGPLQAIVRGQEAFDDADPMRLDTLFRLYSMTKPVTGVAAAMLIDEGVLGLDQPVADFIPEFGKMTVAIAPSKGLEARPAKSLITVRHLLTHTAGFGYGGLSTGPIGEALKERGLAPWQVSNMPIPILAAKAPTPSLEVFVRRLAEVPLYSDPGTRFRYSTSLDVLALVIQRAAKAASFEAFLQERLFAPAGMADSFFTVPKAKANRLATNYGVLFGMALPIDKPASSVFLKPPAFAFGGSGLVASPRDYDRFLTMLAHGGMVGGRRVMRESAVDLATSNLLPPAVPTAGTLIAGAGFGAGGRVGLGARAGEFGWAGAAGTIGFVDRKRALRAALYAQYMPVETWPVHEQFPKAIAADLASAKL